MSAEFERPIVQLYCKKLALDNLESFLEAHPDHIGWQINLNKLTGDELQRALDQSAAIARRLEAEAITSVFLLHPSTDLNAMASAISQVNPDIFLTSAERNPAALQGLTQSVRSQLMIPIGIPAEGVAPAGYDPLAEMNGLSGLADWFTTDTITAQDGVDHFGCSGQTSRWDVLAAVVSASTAPVVVAGGLRPDNVADLWKLCRPAGFDAHTAVCTDGLPDAEKSKAFTNAVRALT